MNVSRDVCFLSAEHDYRVFGNVCNAQGFEGPPRALGKRRKGHSQESHNNKWQRVFHHIFLLLVNDAGNPPRDLSTGSLQTPCCAHRLIRRIYVPQRQETCPGECAIRELKSGCTILSESNSVGTRREITDAS